MYFHMSAAALDVRSFSRLFKALGDETRLRIVALLSHGELCVCHVEEALRLSQPKVSRHLATPSIGWRRGPSPRRDLGLLPAGHPAGRRVRAPAPLAGKDVRQAIRPAQ